MKFTLMLLNKIWICIIKEMNFAVSLSFVLMHLCSTLITHKIHFWFVCFSSPKLLFAPERQDFFVVIFFQGLENYFRYSSVDRLGRVEPPSHTSATDSSQSQAFSHAPYNRRALYSFAGLSEGGNSFMQRRHHHTWDMSVMSLRT